VGAETSQGWLVSNGFYAQLLTRLRQGMRLLARISETTTQFDTAGLAENTEEVGGYLHLDARITAGLRLGVRALLRVPVTSQTTSGTSTPGGVLGADASGAF
jgi:hypothetical protein